MSSSNSSKSSIISETGFGFEQGGGEQQETEQISNLERKVQELKNVVRAKNSKLQDLKRQLDEIENGQTTVEFEQGGGEQQETPDIEALIRNDGPNGFVAYRPDFFDNLIKHFYESENPDELAARLNEDEEKKKQEESSDGCCAGCVIS